jgi:hypothetical protein
VLLRLGLGLQGQGEATWLPRLPLPAFNQSRRAFGRISTAPRHCAGAWVLNLSSSAPPAWKGLGLGLRLRLGMAGLRLRLGLGLGLAGLRLGLGLRLLISKPVARDEAYTSATSTGLFLRSRQRRFFRSYL